MYKLTIRTGKYNTQLLVRKFGHRTKTIKKKVQALNLKKVSKKMAKLFGTTRKQKLSLPWA